MDDKSSLSNYRLMKSVKQIIEKEVYVQYRFCDTT